MNERDETMAGLRMHATVLQFYRVTGRYKEVIPESASNWQR